MFWTIGPYQYGAEIHIDRKILRAMGGSNPGPTDERPVFYHYTNDFTADKHRNNDDYLENSNHRSNECYNSNVASINTS